MVSVDTFADKIVYYENEKKTVLSGNVVIKYEDIKIEADNVVIDDTREEIYSEGRVKFSRGEESLSGERLRYSMKNKEGVMHSASGLSHPFYFDGEKIIFKEKEGLLFSAGITTCNLSSPHYSIISEQTKIYYKDKMIAKKIKFRLLGKTVFYFPLYVVSLKEKDRQPFTPHISHNQQDGWAIKTAYNYYLKQIGYGALYLDWVEKKGSGAGIKQNFKIGEGGETSLYIYHLQEQDKNKTSYNLDLLTNYKFSKNLLFLSDIKYTNQRLSYLQEIKTLTATGQLQRTKETDTTTGGFTLRRIGTPIDRKDYKITFGQNYKYNKIQRTIYLDFLESSIKKGYPNQELNTRIEMARQVQDGYVSILLQKRIDLDREKNTMDRYSVLNQEPQIMFSSSLRRRNKTYPIKYSLLFGRYYEEPKGTREDKFSFSSSSNLYRTEKVANLNFSFDFSQDFYSTGEAKYQIQILPSATLSYSKTLKHILRWNYQYSRGPSPFSFDRYGRTNNLSTELFFSPFPSLKTKIVSSYDFLSKRYQPLQNYTDIKFSGKLTSSFYFDYDLHRKIYGNLNGTTVYDNKKDLSCKMFYLYNINRRELLKIDGDLSFKKIKGWDINYKTSYLPQQKKFAYNDFLIVRDLHCWQARITYRHYRKEIYVEFNIKAFPKEKILIGIDESGLQYQTTLTNF